MSGMESAKAVDAPPLRPQNPQCNTRRCPTEEKETTHTPFRVPMPLDVPMIVSVHPRPNQCHCMDALDLAKSVSLETTFVKLAIRINKKRYPNKPIGHDLLLDLDNPANAARTVCPHLAKFAATKLNTLGASPVTRTWEIFRVGAQKITFAAMSHVMGTNWQTEWLTNLAMGNSIKTNWNCQIHFDVLGWGALANECKKKLNLTKM